MANLAITPPLGFTGSFDLRVAARATEAVTGDSTARALPLTVTVLPAAITSPIVLDLNGDGIHTINVNDTTGRFDLLNTGTAIRSGWLSSEDGFLAIDRNGNGRIDDRSELFGGAIGEGFQQLAAFDTNRDGIIDSRDIHFNELLIWRDQNSNHQTDAGELHALSDFDIAALHLGYTIKPEQQNGNWLLERSTATLSDGHTMEMADAYFAVDPTPTGIVKSNREEEHSQAATITVRSRPAPPRPEVPQFPLGTHPILTNWPLPHPRPGNQPTAAWPTIDWGVSALQAAGASDEDDTTKRKATNPWLTDFLGATDSSSEDLGERTGLKITLKAKGDGSAH